MTSPRAHPYGETLMSFAAGTLDPAFALVLDCHLHFCPVCRRRVGALEDVGGLLLEGMPAGKDEAFSLRTMSRFSAESAQALSSPDQGARPDPGNEAVDAGAACAHRQPASGESHFVARFFAWRAQLRTRAVLSRRFSRAHREDRTGRAAPFRKAWRTTRAVLWGAYRYDGAPFRARRSARYRPQRVQDLRER